MTKQVVTTLPSGYWVGGAHWREARLRELTGEDHVFLMEECRGLLPAHWVTETLSRCVIKLGPNEATPEAIRSLTVGDREALLLHLRRLSMGDHLTCLLSCPAPECHEKLELEINVADVLLSPEGVVSPEHELTVGREDGGATAVRFRLPTGGDQEAVASLARTDIVAAADSLLRRCLLSVSDELNPTDELPAEIGEQVTARMAELDAQAQIILLATCEACGGSFSVAFDTASYLIQELEAEFQRLYREIHLLAFHYHWSLTEILGMSARKRRRFLELLDDELTRGVVQ
jgi:hypothetical protein